MYRTRLYALFHSIWSVGLLCLLTYDVHQAYVYQNNYWYSIVCLTGLILLIELSIIHKELLGFKAFSNTEGNYLYGTVRSVNIKRTIFKFYCSLNIETTGSANVTLTVSSWINYFSRWKQGHLVYLDNNYIAVLPKSTKNIKFKPLTLFSWLKKGQFSPVYRK